MTICSIIALALIGLVVYPLFQLSGAVKREAYKWWYKPWFALVYTVLWFGLYKETEPQDWALLQHFFTAEYEYEAVWSLVAIGLWIPVRALLNGKSLEERLLRLFRNAFASGRDDKLRVLPFPYFLDEEDQVRARVGRDVYRLSLKIFIITLAAIYAIFFLLLGFNVIKEFYLVSAFGILGLLPLVEYYRYLCAEVPVESETVEGGTTGPGDFDALWRLYLDTFDNYSVAWKKTKSAEDKDLTRKWEADNNADFDDLRRIFMDKTNRYNFIIERFDVLVTLMKLEPLFDYVENNGRNVLIALDIPNHFKMSEGKSFADEIAALLSEKLKKTFFVYDRQSSRSVLNNSLVIAPLALLSRQGIDVAWMRKIGLITVVDFFDKGVSNLHECRKFGYILQSVNKEYKVIFVTPKNLDTEPALKNTWFLGDQMSERQIRQFPRGDRQFFIGYNYEEFQARFGRILAATPSEALTSGSEMATLALCSRLDGRPKVVIPVHYLDLAYSNVVEGKEELGRFCDHLHKRYLLLKDDINAHIRNHLLPIDEIIEDQVFSVIYDVENNAPALYKKWEHLGYEENLSIVISKPYLFRDYFNANHGYFVLSPFDALQPHLCKSRLTLAIMLLNILQKADMDEATLRNLLDHYYDSREIKSLTSTLQELFRTYFTSDPASLLMTSDDVVFDGGKYGHRISYNLFQLTDAHTPHFLDIVSVKDESGNTLLDLMYDLMYQNYDRGQVHSFSGKPYKIGDYNPVTKTLNVSSVNTSNVLFYRALQRVSIGAPKERTPIEGTSAGTTDWRHPVLHEKISICYVGFETPVTVHTHKWFEFYKYTVLGCESLASNAPERFYPKGKVLKITFRFVQKPHYLEKINDIRKALQLLLYEAMQSVFPHHAQYLLISSIGEGDPDLPWIFNDFSCGETPVSGELSYYFTEDAHIDLGLIGALAADKKNLRYILERICDYLIWLTEGVEEGDGVSAGLPSDYDEFLSRKGLDKLSFLKYGKAALPDYLKDLDLLINFISDLFPDHTNLRKICAERRAKHDVMGACDFCGKKMKNSEMQMLDDGRMRCPDCSQEAIDTEPQFLSLIEQAKAAFKEHLGIDFGSIPYKGNLVSAVELHRAGGKYFSITNGYDTRKLLGMACSGEDAFYVENGYKPMKTLGIIIHEMTHIWQYHDADFKKMRKQNEDLVEGLAVWTDLFLCEKCGEEEIERRRDVWLSLDNTYGHSLKFILDTCPGDPYGYIRREAAKLPA